MKAIMPALTWDDIESIGIELYEARPDVDPLTVRFTDLLTWITELPDFRGNPAASNEGKLEAVQMAWYEEFKENQ